MRLTLTYFFKIVIQRRLLDPGAVTHADREPGAAFHDTAAVFKFQDVFSIYRDPLIDGDKPGVASGLFHEFWHGHAAVQLFSVCKRDVKIVCVRNGGVDLAKEHADGFPAVCKLNIFLLLRQHLYGVRQYVKNALPGERLRDIFKGVAGEGIRHKFRAGGQKYQEAPAVHAAHPQCGGNSVYAVHVDIHENNGEASALKRVKKGLSAGKGDRLHRAAGLGAEITAEPRHLIQAFPFVVH